MREAKERFKLRTCHYLALVIAFTIHGTMFSAFRCLL
jgi:hypothetical protein